MNDYYNSINTTIGKRIIKFVNIQRNNDSFKFQCICDDGKLYPNIESQFYSENILSENEEIKLIREYEFNNLLESIKVQIKHLVIMYNSLPLEKDILEPLNKDFKRILLKLENYMNINLNIYLELDEHDNLYYISLDHISKSVIQMLMS